MQIDAISELDRQTDQTDEMSSKLTTIEEGANELSRRYRLYQLSIHPSLQQRELPPQQRETPLQQRELQLRYCVILLVITR